MAKQANSRATVALAGLLAGSAVLLPRESLADLVVSGDILFPSFLTGAESESGNTLIRLEGRRDAEAFAAWPDLIARGDYREALAFAERYLASNPKSGLAHEARGTALIMLRQFDKAQQAFLEASRVEDGQSGPWFKLGMVQMESNELKKAEASLNRALAIDPANRFVHQRLGMLYDYLGRDEEAITQYRQGLVGASLAYVGVAVDLGRLLNQYGRFAETIEVLEPRLPVSSGLGQANYILATAYLNTARWAEAETRFARALELGVAPTESRLGIALAQREQGELAAATQTINELIEAEPDAPLPHLERGTIRLAEGRPEQAAEDFATAVALGADPLTGAKALARYYAGQDAFDKARDVLEELVEDGDADPEVYAQLSELYLAMDQQAAGLAVLERGAGAYPDSSYLAFRTASYLAAMTQYDRSLPWFERALSLAPQNPAALRAYSLALSRTGDLARSADVAGELYALRPDRPAVAVFYAARLEGAGQVAEAESVYRELLEQAPDVPLALNNLASILAARGAYREAEPYARRATELVPDNGRLLDTLGWVLYGDGAYGEAAEILGRAAALEPGLAVIQYHHGMAASKAGDPARASDALRRALDLEPEASWAPQARDRLAQLLAPAGR
jgi:tetratricopeptide (TPR) repeat protein